MKRKSLTAETVAKARDALSKPGAKIEPMRGADGKRYFSVWLPKSAWTRAAPNVSLKLKIASSKKKRVVSRAKATAAKGKA